MKIRNVLAAITLATSTVTGYAATQFINVATGGTSGVYYPLGVALSQAISKEIPEAKVSVQATKASVENANLIQSGRAELGFALADAMADAWAGNEEAGFKAPLDKLRAVAAIYPNYIHVVAHAGSGIRSMADLKGKRLSVGAPRSGNELNARAVLSAAGIAYTDLSRVEYMPFGESVELLKNRQIDATLLSGGLGVAAVRDLTSSVDVVFVPIPPEVVAKIGNAAYQAGIVPAGTYQGQDEDLPTVSIRNLLFTHAGMSDDTVYAVTKSLFDNLEQLANAHAAARSIDKEQAAIGLPLPLHPGAERYFRETGLIK